MKKATLLLMFLLAFGSVPTLAAPYQDRPPRDGAVPTPRGAPISVAVSSVVRPDEVTG